MNKYNNMKENIPEELKKVNQWVCWEHRQCQKTGKMSKIPIDPSTKKKASTDNVNTWGSFEKALRCCKKNNLSGIGFVLSEDDDYMGIDLDNCRNPESGEFEPWAQEIITRMDSYTEISPSGRGVKIFVRGKLPGEKHRIQGLPSFGTSDGGIEIYNDKRYFTVTGDILPESKNRVRKVVQTIKEIYKQYFPEEKNIPAPIFPSEQHEFSDDDVIAKATNATNGEKFARLMEGDISDYDNDASRADQALASMLAFWTRGNKEQIDRIFRNSKIYRNKWDEKHYADGSTYGQVTIQKAINYCTKLYEPISVESSEIIKALDDVEQGDTELFIKIYKNRLCFDHASKLWYIWNGNYWVEDLTNQALASIMELVDLYQRERNRLHKQRRDEEKSGVTSTNDYNGILIKRLDERIAKLKSQHKREHILKLACAGNNSLGIAGHEWDSQPWVMACSNGVLSLKGEEVTFRAGLPDDYIKTAAPTEWQGINAKAPLWKKTLKEIFENDRKLIKHVQKLLGYAISGSAQEHIFIIFTGIGRNGKTTIIETMNHVLGALSDPIPAETLLAQTHSFSGASPRADLIKLRGLRLACASESDEGRRFNAGLLKQLTGGDTITARAPFGKKMISFKPMHTIFFLTNHVPHISVSEYAFWQRVHVIPFNLSFVDSPQESFERKKDAELLEKLKAETPAILAWLVRGCLRWQKHGLLKPKSIENATNNYHHEEDSMSRFLEDCCQKVAKSKVGASNLYEAYEEWCDDNDTECWSQTKFGKEMGKQYTRHTSNGNYYLGLELKKRKFL